LGIREAEVGREVCNNEEEDAEEEDEVVVVATGLVKNEGDKLCDKDKGKLGFVSIKVTFVCTLGGDTALDIFDTGKVDDNDDVLGIDTEEIGWDDPCCGLGIVKDEEGDNKLSDNEFGGSIR